MTRCEGIDVMFIIQGEKKSSSGYRMTTHNADETLRWVGPVGRCNISLPEYVLEYVLRILLGISTLILAFILLIGQAKPHLILTLFFIYH
jgi:hypothetical protein